MNSAAEVIAYLAGLEARFRAAGDRRAVFVSAYLEISKGIAAALGIGFFKDDAWTERYMAAFSRLYKAALDAYDEGRRSDVPRAWRVAFDAARDGTSVVLQDLLMGVNAHVNHDLALALAEVGIGPDREVRHADHTAVNQVLKRTTDALQYRVGMLYAPILKAFVFAAGRFDEAVATFSVDVAREAAWRKAVLLTDMGPMFVRTEIDLSSGVLARAILLPTAMNPSLRKALQSTERGLR